MTTAKHDHQLELERLYNKNQLLTRIKAEFSECKEFDFLGYMEENEIPKAFGLDLLAQMALHKRTTLPTLVGILRPHFNNSQITADMILKAAMADLVDWAPTNRQFIVKFTMTADTQRELDMFQFPLPMVVEPAEVKNNRDVGYLTSTGSIILKNNHHDDDVCLDHINRLNAIKFNINLNTATMVANSWKNLDKPKEGETRQDFEKRVRAFDKYDRTAHDVIGKLIEHGNEFHLTHKYDKRGRTYCQGYHVTYQGAPWNKAVIELANQEVVV